MMSNAIAIIGCLAFLCAVGYGIFHLICKAAKKKNVFQKAVLAPSHRRIYPASDRRLLAEPDASAVKAEEKYSTLDTAYQKLTKEHQALEKNMKASVPRPNRRNPKPKPAMKKNSANSAKR